MIQRYKLKCLQWEPDAETGDVVRHEDHEREVTALQAEVSRLTAELAAARKPQGLTELVTWVPVTERVPDDGRCVQVTYRRKQGRRALIQRAHRTITDGMWRDWDTDEPLNNPVTAWTECLRGPALGAQDGGEDGK